MHCTGSVLRRLKAMPGSTARPPPSALSQNKRAGRLLATQGVGTELCSPASPLSLRHSVLSLHRSVLCNIFIMPAFSWGHFIDW